MTFRSVGTRVCDRIFNYVAWNALEGCYRLLASKFLVVYLYLINKIFIYTYKDAFVVVKEAIVFTETLSNVQVFNGLHWFQFGYVTSASLFQELNEILFTTPPPELALAS